MRRPEALVRAHGSRLCGDEREDQFALCIAEREQLLHNAEKREQSLLLLRDHSFERVGRDRRNPQEAFDAGDGGVDTMGRRSSARSAAICAFVPPMIAVDAQAIEGSLPGEATIGSKTGTRAVKDCATASAAGDGATPASNQHRSLAKG